MIRVLIAEDSSLIAAMMQELLDEDPEIEVVGRAKNGREAIELRNSLEPDVITMDLNMPVLGGLQAISAGGGGTLRVDFAPGNYAFICFVEDPASGVPHFVLGMVEEFTVQ